MKKICDLKKGDRVLLADSHWEADVVERPRGKQPTTVFCNVFGLYTEMGSVYAHDVIAVKDEKGMWEQIELMEKQIACKKMNKELFG